MLFTVCWRRWCSKDSNGPLIHDVGRAELPPNKSEYVVSAFLELAIERFDARFAAHASDEEERRTFEHSQTGDVITRQVLLGSSAHGQTYCWCLKSACYQRRVLT